MTDDQDQSQKTEEPTSRRLEEAVKKGQVITSKELNSFLMLLAFTILLSWIYPYLFKSITSKLTVYITAPHELIIGDNGINVIKLAKRIILDILLVLAIPFLTTIFISLASNLLQHGFILAPEVIKFDFGKVSPLQGFKKIFSAKSVVEFIKGILKIIAISVAIYLALRSDLTLITNVHTFSHYGFLSVMLKLLNKMMIAICITMAFIAVLDYFYQRYDYMKNLMMTKQEIKDEYKQTEGSPEVKAKLKSLRAEKARKRMMSAVPTADVIITNPTHFSIALKYDPDNMPAPQVIAKGQDNIALKIREIAKENFIPIVENPPLARALFKAVEVDEFIPYEHYRAVAEVITYVMKLKGKKFIK